MVSTTFHYLLPPWLQRLSTICCLHGFNDFPLSVASMVSHDFSLPVSFMVPTTSPLFVFFFQNLSTISFLLGFNDISPISVLHGINDQSTICFLLSATYTTFLSSMVSTICPPWYQRPIHHLFSSFSNLHNISVLNGFNNLSTMVSTTNPPFVFFFQQLTQHFFPQWFQQSVHHFSSPWYQRPIQHLFSSLNSYPPFLSSVVSTIYLLFFTPWFE
jgi:hypothetical protein